MRILYEPQISMRSYQDDRWLLASDAQLTKMCACVEALPSDWEWTWILPMGAELEAADARFMGLSNVKIRTIPWPTNVLQHRFHFDMMQNRWLLANHPRFDVMLCEVPEHVRAWRVAQQFEGVKFPIMAMYEHVDIYDETTVDHSFMLRQLEGAMDADVCAFPLKGMRDEWNKAANKLLSIFRSKQAIWPTIFSPDEVNCQYHPMEPNDVPVIFFTGRLSDNQRTHHREFFDACEILRQKGVEFRLWVANPNEAWNWDQVAQVDGYQPHKFGERTLERKEYLRLLWDADVVPVLYPMDKIYSVGFLEAIAADNVMVTQTAEDDSQTTGITVKHMTPGDIATALQAAIGLSRNQLEGIRQTEEQKRWAMRERSVEKNIKYVRHTIGEVVERAQV